MSADKRKPSLGWFGKILVLVVVAALATLLNWPYQYTQAEPRMLGSLDTNTDFPLVTPEPPLMAGYPYRYLIEYRDGETSTFRRFSPLALSYNVGIAIGLAVFVIVYLSLRRRRRGSGKRKLRISIADILVATLLIAASLGFWRTLSAKERASEKLANDLNFHGAAVYRSALVPAFLESKLPTPIKEKLLRTRMVRMEYPPQEVLAELVEAPELAVLRIGGGEFDLGVLGSLAGNPHLADLRIAGRVLDESTLQTIGTLKGLQTLNLMRTNVSVDSLSVLERLPNLQRLSLMRTDVELAGIGAPEWSKSIQELTLGHPNAGGKANVEIEGWPKLHTLVINDLDSQLNARRMPVDLRDLPELKTLHLDVFQAVELTIANCPKLDEISELGHEWQSRLPRGGAAAGAIWCATLELDGVPSMESLQFYAPSLSKLSIKGAPNLVTGSVVAYHRTQDQRKNYVSHLVDSASKALMEGLGESEGPLRVDLYGVPLKDVDLAPLAKNRGIKQLRMSYTETNLKQWKSLGSMDWLTRLEVNNNPINDEAVAWVLKTFPNLEHFAFSAVPDWNAWVAGDGESFVTSLEVIDKPKLRTIDMGGSSTGFLTSIRVVDAPSLVHKFECDFIDRLEIVNAPSLRGIAINGPLPPDIKIEGVRDLEFFAVGGELITDEYIDKLKDCQQLTTLTLAYPAVTKGGLARLPNLSKLESLSLPGSQVDDAIVAKWPAMPALKHLDLRETAVTKASLDRLVRSTQLESIWLDDTKIAKSEFGALAQLNRLRQLSVANIGIEAETLRQVLSKSPVRILNLSYTDVSDEVMDIVANHAVKLELLVMRGANVNPLKIRDMAARYQFLKFDLNGTDVPTQLMTALLTGKRIYDPEDYELSQLRAVRTGELVTMTNPAMIDVDIFPQFKGIYQQLGTAPAQITVGAAPAGAPGGTPGWIFRVMMALRGAPAAATGTPAANTPADDADPSEGDNAEADKTAADNETPGTDAADGNEADDVESPEDQNNDGSDEPSGGEGT